MGIIAKFNLILITVLSLALAGTGFVSYRILQDNARNEVIQHAGMMLQAALAVRGYTVDEIRPLLREKMQYEFLPQSVPAYAATQSFNVLRQKNPEYSYKEATLNPTNPRNRPADWERDIINNFRNNKNEKQIIGVRNTPTGPSLYLSRPIRIGKQGCLICHGHKSDAPRTMRTLYGDDNGFGWQLHEVVGAQIISVPMSVPQQNAQLAFIKLISIIAGIFIFIIIMLNIMLRKIIIRPIILIANQADTISMGDMSTPEFDASGKDELATLSASFNRMRRSLQKAMKMLQDKDPKPH